MAERLAHRDLRNRSAEVLRNVRAGATYEVTNHGEVVAVLSPPAAPERRALHVRPARGARRFTDLRRVLIDHPAQETLDELRGDR